MLNFAPSDYFDLDAFEHRALFDGVSYVWEALDRLPTYLAAFKGRRLEGRVSPGAWLEGEDIVIASGAHVDPTAYICGPAIIGPDAEVRHGAWIRGHAILGRGAVVGHATEVKNSIFLDGAKAGHFAYVGDSLLGRDVNLGAGTKLANLRFDGAPVVVRVGDRRLDTRRRKLGAILGDGCELGCNVVTNPGTILGRRSMVHPAIAIHGVHPEGSVLSAASFTRSVPSREVKG